MVCLGNICRSPLAEGILQDKAWKAGLKWSVESAGTNGSHTGEAPHPLSQKVARINGVDISKQRSRKFVAEDFHRFDKIYAMSDDVIDDMRRIAKNNFDEKKVDLLLNELFPGQNVDVPDPWYGPEPGYHEVYKMINEACDAIIKKYTPQPPKGVVGSPRRNICIKKPDHESPAGILAPPSGGWGVINGGGGAISSQNLLR